MDKSKVDIWVYAHWIGMKDPRCIGTLSAHFGKGRNRSALNMIKNGFLHMNNVTGSGSWVVYRTAIPKRKREFRCFSGLYA